MRIAAISEALPGEPVGNAEMAKRYGLHEKWLDMMTGNRSRYLCRADSPADVPKCTSDLAVAAGDQVLNDAEIDPVDLDFLILATATPDHLMPATVNLVADRLGINEVQTFQLTSGCAGALQALVVAQAMLAVGHRRGLVIGADCCLKITPCADDIVRMSPNELINFALFGDGAGAVLVEADDNGPGLVLEHILLRFVGLGRKPGQVANWYGADGAPVTMGAGGVSVREPWGLEDYKAIEHHVPGLAEQILKELTAHTGWSLGSVEHVLTPQLNGVMTEKIREHVGVRPDQAVNCVADTGNNGNAVPFIQLNRTMQRIANGIGSGGRVLVATVESSKWIMSGMAMRHQPGRVGDDR